MYTPRTQSFIGELFLNFAHETQSMFVPKPLPSVKDNDVEDDLGLVQQTEKNELSFVWS